MCGGGQERRYKHKAESCSGGFVVVWSCISDSGVGDLAETEFDPPGMDHEIDGSSIGF